MRPPTLNTFTSTDIRLKHYKSPFSFKHHKTRFTTHLTNSSTPTTITTKTPANTKMSPSIIKQTTREQSTSTTPKYTTSTTAIKTTTPIHYHQQHHSHHYDQHHHHHTNRNHLPHATQHLSHPGSALPQTH